MLGWVFSFTIYNYAVDKGGYFHSSAASPRTYDLPWTLVKILGSVSVWTLWTEEKTFALFGNRNIYPQPFSPNLITMPNMQSRRWRYQLTKSMEQSSSWEANRSPANQEYLRFLGKQKVRYSTYNSPPPLLVLSYSDPVRDLHPHFSKIHFSIIFPSTRGSFKFSFPQVSSLKSYMRTSTLSHTCYMSYTFQSSWLDHLNVIWSGIQSIKLLVE
jgi:hypothetical protein